MDIGVRKKVLYSVQATGNGHLSRCMEFYPILNKYADVDVMLSGIQGDLNLPFQPKIIRHGLSFVFGKKGGVDYWKTFKSLKPFTAIRDIIALDLSPYDMVVSDFEPLSAWKAKLKGIPCVGLSHQAAFLSKKSPRPKGKYGLFAEFLFKCFAPATRVFGLHFVKYDDHIYTPVVRSEIRQLKTAYIPENVLVYLPAVGEEMVINHLKNIPNYNWKIFSKHTKLAYKEGRIEVFPVGTAKWADAMRSCASAIIGAGFEGNSEMLFLKKRIMAIPMVNQYEQLCNARSLSDLGVTVVKNIDSSFGLRVREWLKNGQRVEVDYPYITDQIVREILEIE